MHELGYLILMASLVVSVFSGVASVVGHRRGIARLQQAGYASAFATAGLITVASLALIYLFVAQDFSVKYVHHYSDRSMPLIYVITAFWGGQDGSLLFWVWVLALYSVAALWLNREHVRLIPWATAVLMATVAFFVILLLFAANPFDTFLGTPPADGKGLNPLLQNAYMSIHPPTLYLGYIGMSIPFAFAMASLAAGQMDETWLRITRRWTLFAWFFLAVGLILGKLWAYEELGWGGYWAWDPVENAGFLPWLTCTAFLHSVMIQERRGMFRVWNMVLVIHSFALTLVGTFLTRSGVVQSVHSFAQSSVGTYFLVFLVICLIFSIGLMFYRYESLAAEVKIDSMLSREFSFLLNNWILVGMTYFILLATLFPSLSDFFMGEKITVGPPFYNKWMIPLGLILLMLTAVGPLIAWRKASGDSLKKQFTWPIVWGVVAGLVAISLGALAGGGWTIATYVLCGVVTGSIVQEFWRGTRVRMKNAGENALDAMIGLMSRAKRRYGGYVIHFGVVLMFFGWAGNAYKVEKDVTLAKGEVAQIGSFQVKYEDLRFGETKHKGEVTAYLSVLDKSGVYMGTYAPAKWMYRKSEQPTTEVSIRSTLVEDLYLVLAGWDPANGNVMLRLVINPFTMWVWLGSGFLVLGIVVVMWPDRHKRRYVGSGRRATTAGVILALALPSLAAAKESTDIPLPPHLEQVAHEINVETVCLCGGCSRLQNSICTCGYAAENREDFRRRLAAGASKQQILDYYVQKFGAEILSAPPDTGFNRLAWALPYGALGLGAVGLFFFGRSWVRRSREGNADIVPADHLAREVDLSEPEEELYREQLADALEDLD